MAHYLAHRASRTLAPVRASSSQPLSSSDLRLYDFRHTCETMLLATGENAKVVSERLGHAGITLTLDTYAHVLPGMQKKAAERLENLLFG